MALNTIKYRTPLQFKGLIQ